MGKFVLVVILFAVLVYGVLRLLERRKGGGSGGSGARLSRGPQRPSGPQRRTIAPDDDDEFLRGLNRRKKHGDKSGDEPPSG